MTGAEHIMKTLAQSGVKVCFANPGTSEMRLVGALENVPEMRPVLCLFEGVTTAAADGYARMTGQPACTMLHLGPDFANSAANSHNARRGFSPMINIIGEHATFHVANNAPYGFEGLTSEVKDGDTAAVFTLPLKKGPMALHTWFRANRGKASKFGSSILSAYYVYVRRK